MTEKQLLAVAGGITHNWREVGIDALEIGSEKLDEIEADNTRVKMRVFQMLRYWRNRQKQAATADKLLSLLSEEGLDIAPEKLECLQKSS